MGRTGVVNGTVVQGSFRLDDNTSRTRNGNPIQM
jgi:hypothetical protein